MTRHTREMVGVLLVVVGAILTGVTSFAWGEQVAKHGLPSNTTVPVATTRIVAPTTVAPPVTSPPSSTVTTPSTSSTTVPFFAVVHKPDSPDPVPPAFPVNCGTSYSYTPHTYSWMNIPCGVDQPGYCWAPPVLTYPGEAPQTGLDYTRQECG